MRKLITFLLLFITGVVSATNYYVDNVGTGDTLATIAEVNALTLSGGDTVFFKRGSTWRENLTISQSGTLGNNIVFTSYGTGAKPEIVGSETSTWTNVSGNVWQSASTMTVDPYINGSFESEIFFEETDGSVSWGTHQVYVDLSELTQEYDWTWNANTIYIYSPTDPNSRYSSIEIPQRDYCIDLGNENEYIEIDSLQVHYAKNINIYDHDPNSALSGFVLDSCVLSYVGSIANESGYNLAVCRSDYVVKNCEIFQGGRRQISFHVYDADNLTFSNITIEGCSLHDGYHGSGIGIAMDGVRSGNRFEDIVIRNNDIYNTSSRDPIAGGWGFSLLLSLRVSETNGSIARVKIYNNLFRNTEQTGLTIENVDTCYIYHNTFYGFSKQIKRSDSYGYQVQLANGSTGLDFQNNIFYGDNDYANYSNTELVLLASQSTSEVSMDYNLFYQQSDTMSLCYITDTYYRTVARVGFGDSDWNDFKTTYPTWEVHDVSTNDPKFVSSSDLSLQNISPAIDAGVTISGYTTDIINNSWYNPPSIGAYEYSPRTYYVSNTGSDSNNGLTTSTPWQTISYVNAQTFEPGDSILFKRGDTWREKLTVPSSGTSSNYITFSNYGSGNNPQIFGSEVSTGWTLYSGNVWVSDVTFTDPRSLYPNYADLTFILTNDSLVWGSFKTYVDLSELTQEYDWTWNTSDSKIYIYAATDPDTRYNSVEVPQRRQCVETGNNEYLGFDGIDVFFSTEMGYDTYSAHTDHINLSGMILKNSEISHIGGITGTQVGYGVALIYSDMTISNNTIYECGRRGLSLDIYGSGFTVTNVVIENNTFSAGYHTTGVDLSVGSGSYTGSYDSVIVRNNLFYEPSGWTNTSNQIFFQNYDYAGGGATTDRVYVYNNIFKYTSGTCIMLEGVNNINIYHNDFYETLEVGSYTVQLWVDANVSTVIVKDNIFYNSGSTDVFGRAIYCISSYTGLTVDYNTYYRINSSVNIIKYNSSLYTMSDQALIISDLGWETNGVFANPMFVSTSNLQLQSSSPSVGTGVIISGITTDHDGVSYSSPPSIGAYEYIPPAPEVKKGYFHNGKPLFYKGKIIWQ